MPVSSFAPELLALLQKAAREQVVVRLPDRASATTLRHRLYSLRTAMRKEDHELTHVVDPVTITLREDHATGQWILTASPADTSYLSAIRQAGVDVNEEFSETDDDDSAGDSLHTTGAVADYLNKFKED